MQTTTYAVIQTSTRAVYGIGETPDRARDDAARNGMECACDERDGDCAHAYGALLDGFEVVPCTPAAAQYVNQHGGQPSASLAVSRDGVSLSSEE